MGCFDSGSRDCFGAGMLGPAARAGARGSCSRREAGGALVTTAFEFGSPTALCADSDPGT